MSAIAPSQIEMQKAALISLLPSPEDFNDCWDFERNMLDPAKIRVKSADLSAVHKLQIDCATASYNVLRKEDIKCKSFSEWAARALEALGGIDEVAQNSKFRRWQREFVKNPRKWQEDMKARTEHAVNHELRGIKGTDEDRVKQATQGLAPGKHLRRAFVPAVMNSGKTLVMWLLGIVWPWDVVNAPLDIPSHQDCLKTRERILYLFPQKEQILNFIKQGVSSTSSEAELKSSCLCRIIGLPLWLVKDLASHVVHLKSTHMLKRPDDRQRVDNAWIVMATQATIGNACSQEIKFDHKPVTGSGSWTVIVPDEGDIGTSMNDENVALDHFLRTGKPPTSGVDGKPTSHRNIQLHADRAKLVMFSAVRLNWHVEQRLYELGKATWVDNLNARDSCTFKIAVTNPVGMLNVATQQPFAGPDATGEWDKKEALVLRNSHMYLVAQAQQAVRCLLEERQTHNLPFQLIVFMPASVRDQNGKDARSFRMIKDITDALRDACQGVHCGVTNRELRVEYVSSKKKDDKEQADDDDDVVNNRESFFRLDGLFSDILLMCQTCKRGYSNDFLHVGINLVPHGTGCNDKNDMWQGYGRLFRTIKDNVATLDLINAFCSRSWACVDCQKKLSIQQQAARNREDNPFPTGEQFTKDFTACQACAPTIAHCAAQFMANVTAYTEDQAHESGLKLQTSIMFESHVNWAVNGVHMNTQVKDEKAQAFVEPVVEVDLAAVNNPPLVAPEMELIVAAPDVAPPVPPPAPEDPIAVLRRNEAAKEALKERKAALKARQEARLVEWLGAELVKSHVISRQGKVTVQIKVGKVIPGATLYWAHSASENDVAGEFSSFIEGESVQIDENHPGGGYSFNVPLERFKLSRAAPHARYVRFIVKLTGNDFPVPDSQHRFKHEDLQALMTYNCLRINVPDLDDSAHEKRGFLGESKASKPAAAVGVGGGGGGGGGAPERKKKNADPGFDDFMVLSSLSRNAERRLNLCRCLMFELFGNWPKGNQGNRMGWAHMGVHYEAVVTAAKEEQQINPQFRLLMEERRDKPDYQTLEQYELALGVAPPVSQLYRSLIAKLEKPIRSGVSDAGSDDAFTVVAIAQPTWDTTGVISLAEQGTLPGGQWPPAPPQGDRDDMNGVNFYEPPPPPKKSVKRAAQNVQAAAAKKPKAPAPPAESESESDEDFFDSDDESESESHHSGPSNEGRGHRFNVSWDGLCKKFDGLKDLVERRFKELVLREHKPRLTKMVGGKEVKVPQAELDRVTATYANASVCRVRAGCVARFNCAKIEPVEAREPVSIREIFDPAVTDWGKDGLLANLLRDNKGIAGGKKEGGSGGNTNMDFNRTFNRLWVNFLADNMELV